MIWITVCIPECMELNGIMFLVIQVGNVSYVKRMDSLLRLYRVFIRMAYMREKKRRKSIGICVVDAENII